MTQVAGRPRVVFDCNVLVQAVSNRDGPAGRSLALLEQNRIDVFLSRAVLKELRSVLSRDQDLLALATDHSIIGKQFRQRFPRMKMVNPVEFLSAFSLA